GRYAKYLRGLTGLGEFHQRLVRLSRPEEVEEFLSEIEAVSRGTEIPAEPIRLVNYHTNCAL
ncbi:MAG TPA: hypothetical protein VNU72_10555, partial [Puia sp.]|nr:hypothetical protein [Puia sp.]